nr:hypothetical protein [uncultured Pseudacidovorax sp.]
MAEHAEEQVAAVVKLVLHRVGRHIQGFVDGLVEAHDLFGVRRLVGALLGPQPHDAGTRRAVLGNQVQQREPLRQPGIRMHQRMSRDRLGVARSQPVRLVALGLLGLDLLHVVRDGTEKLAGAVAQVVAAECLRGLDLCRGVVGPFVDQALPVSTDEVGQAHAGLLSASG